MAASTKKTKMESLFGPELVSKAGPVATATALADADVVGVYFSASWCGPCRGFTPKLAAFYAERQKQTSQNHTPRFEIVFASSDKSEADFDAYYEEMPWLALPIADRDARRRLSDRFRVSKIPTLVLVDAKTGDTICTDGRENVDARPEAFPWPALSLGSILGDMMPEILEKKKEKKTDCVEEEEEEEDAPTTSSTSQTRPFAEVLAKNRYLGLYFSAHWCPPCRGFTPDLVEYYEEVTKQRSDFDIIFCSSDNNDAAFHEYYAQMPWLAIPFENREAKEALSKLFAVRGIPSLVVIEKANDGQTWELLTRDGRARAASRANFPDDWRPKPYGDLAETVEGKGTDINDAVSIIVLLDRVERDDAKSRVLDAFKTLAEARASDADLLFFYATRDVGPVSKIRELTGTAMIDDAAAKTNKLTLLKLDIPSGGAFYLKDDLDVDEVDLARLEAFVDDDASLERRQLGAA